RFWRRRKFFRHECRTILLKPDPARAAIVLSFEVWVLRAAPWTRGDAKLKTQNPKPRFARYSRCPIFSRLVWRYLALCGFATALIGSCSTILRPYPSRPTAFFGL